MQNRRLTLIKDRRNRKLHRVLAFLFFVAIIGLGVYFAAVEFSLEEIQLQGVNTYTENEVIGMIQNDEDYVPNTLAMIILHKISDKNYLPFIEHIEMSFDDPHILKVKVKEGLRAGVFEQMGQKVYFDSEGVAWETRDSLLEGVPIVTGVKFKKSDTGSQQIVLGEQIPVEGDYFDTIIMITKKIATYQLDISNIEFEKENDIYLVSGNFKIHLGNSQYLGSKMSRISEVLAAVSEKYDKGTIDMHLFTDEKDIITFYE